MTKQLAPEAFEGYNASDLDRCPYLFSSNSYYAWSIGRWLQRTGRSFPRDVRASKSYRFHCNGMLLQMTDKHGATHVERLK